MAKHMTKEEVLQLSDPTDITQEDLSDIYEIDDLFVSESGELLVVEYEEIPFEYDLWGFMGPVSDYTERIEKHLSDINRIARKLSKYNHLAKGIVDFTGEKFYYIHIARKANIEEETRWKEARLEEVTNALRKKESKLIKAIRQAQSLGLKLVLDDKIRKVIEDYNKKMELEYPRIPVSKLSISI